MNCEIKTINLTKQKNKNELRDWTIPVNRFHKIKPFPVFQIFETRNKNPKWYKIK